MFRQETSATHNFKEINVFVGHCKSGLTVRSLLMPSMVVLSIEMASQVETRKENQAMHKPEGKDRLVQTSIREMASREEVRL